MAPDEVVASVERMLNSWAAGNVDTEVATPSTRDPWTTGSPSESLVLVNYGSALVPDLDGLISVEFTGPGTSGAVVMLHVGRDVERKLVLAPDVFRFDVGGRRYEVEVLAIEYPLIRLRPPQPWQPP